VYNEHQHVTVCKRS